MSDRFAESGRWWEDAERARSRLSNPAAHPWHVCDCRRCRALRALRAGRALTDPWPTDQQITDEILRQEQAHAHQHMDD